MTTRAKHRHEWSSTGWQNVIITRVEGRKFRTILEWCACGASKRDTLSLERGDKGGLIEIVSASGKIWRQDTRP